MIARYLAHPSVDLGAWDLFAPATDEDLEWAMGTRLTELAGVSWKLTRMERVAIKKLQTEWATPEVLSAAEVRRRLLCLGLVRLHVEMHEPQRVRFGRKWFAGGEVVRPAEWLYGTGRSQSTGDSFDIDGCPMAEDVDRFARLAEQRLIGYAREELRELATEVLDNALGWSRSGSDVLDQPQSITTSLTAEMDARASLSVFQPELEPVEIEDWGARYCDALDRLRGILTRARLEALLSCFKGIYASQTGQPEGSQRRSRLSNRAHERVKRNLHRIPEAQRDAAGSLVSAAVKAVCELAALDEPLPRQGVVNYRHTRSPRTKRGRAR